MSSGRAGVVINTDVLEAEVHRKALNEIAYEMGVTLMRTSGSPIVTEAKDLSCAVLDTDVEVIGYLGFAAPHISTSFLGVRAVLSLYELDEIQPGDAFIVNDPHTSGALHQGDVGITMPYYYDDTLVGWGFVNEHLLDIGGGAVSGFAADATDVFAEALRFPGNRFVRDGRIEKEWRMFLETNVRSPVAVLNDLRGMLAALHAGQRRLSLLIDQVGRERHETYCRVNKDLSEQMVRQRIDALPDGEYTSLDWVEYHGPEGPGLHHLRCTLRIEGDSMTVTFEAAPQVRAPINTAPPAVLGQAMSTMQSTYLHDVPPNGGIWRPFKWDLGPKGSIVNSEPPAPVSYGHASCALRVDKAFRDALSQALALSTDPSVRARVAGQPNSCMILFTLSGVDERSGESTVMFPIAQTIGLGGPAHTRGDGQDTYSNTGNNGSGMAAVEIDEAAAPALILWRRILPETSGPGEFRGGLGTETAFQIRDAEMMAGSASNAGAVVPPRGAAGAPPAATSAYRILRDTNVDELASNGTLVSRETLSGSEVNVGGWYVPVTLTRGDVVVITNGGGSGVGDPIDREPEAVSDDIRDGWVSADVASVVYGVILHEGVVDVEATAARRSEIRRERLGADPIRATTRELHESGRSVALVAGEWICTRCGEGLGASSDNYRTLCVVRRRPAGDFLEPLRMTIERSSEPTIVIAEHFCPGCGSSVVVDVTADDDVVLPPRLTDPLVDAMSIGAAPAVWRPTGD